MNKREANIRSTEGTISIGDLRRVISVTRNISDNKMSRVNPSLTLKAACDIYEKALAGRNDSEIPAGKRYDVYRERDVPSYDSLLIRNVLRDCV
jgi:hypothetical protein